MCSCTTNLVKGDCHLQPSAAAALQNSNSWAAALAWILRRGEEILLAKVFQKGVSIGQESLANAEERGEVNQPAESWNPAVRHPGVFHSQSMAFGSLSHLSPLLFVWCLIVNTQTYFYIMFPAFEFFHQSLAATIVFSISSARWPRFKKNKNTKEISRGKKRLRCPVEKKAVKFSTALMQPQKEKTHEDYGLVNMLHFER